jgi:hypothetical protein
LRLDFGGAVCVEVAAGNSLVNPSVDLCQDCFDDGLSFNTIGLRHFRHGLAVTDALDQIAFSDADGGGCNIEPSVDSVQPPAMEVPMTRQMGRHRVRLIRRDGAVGD